MDIEKHFLDEVVSFATVPKDSPTDRSNASGVSLKEDRQCLSVTVPNPC